jgi:signal transduction histidine kinase
VPPIQDNSDDFLATLAHEMQTPLFAMQLAAELIARHPDRIDEVTRGNSLMRRQIAQLQRLVADLLDVARVRCGKLELRAELLELLPIVQAAAEASGPLIAARRHSLCVTPPMTPLPVMADPARLLQIVCNLLNNAAKFTPPGGHIRVSVEAVRGHAVLRVLDDGIGIAKDKLVGIFEPYMQIRPSDKSLQPGIGVGLGLARSLAELHGGTLEARSAGREKGSEFIVRLPLVEIPAHSYASAQTGARARTIVHECPKTSN